MNLYSISKAFLLSLLIPLLLASCAGPDATNIATHQLFTDHAVLQRGISLPVWGTASPGGTLEVTLSGNTQATEADSAGNWKVEFPEMEAGGPYELRIEGGDTSIVLQDILIGDVWLASGQSNMEWPLSAQVDNFEQEIAEADYPEIRLFSVKRNTSYEPLQDLEEGSWQPTTPETIGSFSAVAYFFGREIQQEIGVPIGLIKSAWGGTPAEAWTSEAALMEMQEFEEELQQIEQQLQVDPSQTDVALRKVRDSLLMETAKQLENDAMPERNTASWSDMEIPTNWESAGLTGFDGIVWFQKQVEIPEASAGKGLTLHLGQIDDADITWFNGQKIGQTNTSSNYRTYEVPAAAVQAGTNTITIRVQDNGGDGGLRGPAEEMYLEQQGEKIDIDLTGNWQYEASERLPEVDRFPVEPAILYNAMINPLIPYKIRGVIWYQGESNASRAEQYRTLFPLMIEDWRDQWGEGAFPFLFVQLANFITGPPGNAYWAELREAQTMALDLDNTGMAVTIDIGDSLDIHPRNKQDVGKRLALAALKVAYGQDNAWSGPLYESMRIQGDSAIITFEEVDEGLMVVGNDKLTGFTIAGEDQQFYPATARIISENEVSVKSRQVESPVAVRYGWTNNPKTNLYNEAFLPASPFRTDEWTGVEDIQSGI
jgi:sialate O-acetylesterase